MTSRKSDPAGRIRRAAILPLAAAALAVASACQSVLGVDATAGGYTTEQVHTFMCGSWRPAAPPASRVVADVYFAQAERSGRARPQDLRQLRHFGARIIREHAIGGARIAIDTDRVAELGSFVNSLQTVTNVSDLRTSALLTYRDSAGPADEAELVQRGGVVRARWRNHISVHIADPYLHEVRLLPAVERVEAALLMCVQ